MLVELESKYLKKGQYKLQAKGVYNDESRAIEIFTLSGEPMCVATSCLEEYGLKPADGNVFIKNYSENAGIMEALVKAGIIGVPVKEYEMQYVTFYECPLLIKHGAS